MFVLSVGFLMAQGVFTYQAVVVDNEGNLVVDQTVNATVTIQSSAPNLYVQTYDGVQTSLNGLVLLPIGSPDNADFMAIDWKTATIKVQFTPVMGSDVNLPNADYERVAGVPYALQTAGEEELTTDMIAEYYGRATTTMDDMEAIFAALESNENLSEGLIHAFIDTVKNNRLVAKQILLHYLNTGTVDDVQALYDAYDGNDELKDGIKILVRNLIEENRELVYEILRQYALLLTPDEVEDIVDAIPNGVKDRIVVRAANYLKDPQHKTTLIIPVFMDYVANITTDEFDELIQTLQNNGPVFEVMLKHFYGWMDEYFENYFTGGTHVEEVVAAAIESNFYAQCDPEIDLCQLKADLEALNTCFEPSSTEFLFGKDADENLVYTLNYQGTDPSDVQVDVSIDGGTPETILNSAVINPEGNTITITLTPSMIEYIPGSSLQAVITITVDCADAPITAVGFYSED